MTIFDRLYVLTALVVLSLLMVGCNNDIFIDDADIPEEDVSVTVEGDGGEAVLDIRTKDLLRVTVDVFSSQKEIIRYYNADGELVNEEVPASDLGKIVYDDIYAYFEIVKAGNKLTFKNIEQPFPGVYQWSVRLEYTYGIKLIHVTALAGSPVEMIDVSYEPDLAVNPIAEVRTKRIGFNNVSSLPQICEVQPFLQTSASFIVERTQAGHIWADNLKVDMSVPIYQDGDWIMMPREGIEIGESYKSYRPDQMSVVEVEVPAGSHVDIYTDITYAEAICGGTMTFRWPVTHRTRQIDFKATSLYPVSYEIRVEEKQ